MMHKYLWLTALFIPFVIGLTAQNTKAQVVAGRKTILVWPNGAPGAKGDTPADKPDLTIFLPPQAKATETGVLVCPGGGYSHEAMDKEGYKVAEWLNSFGVAAFVLKYRHGER
ncbi:MAG TPA: hypothetical protein VKA08_13190, partial [Balneolales bacterium]|nr:hypothetical protein [Balneolales bacterium]